MPETTTTDPSAFPSTPRWVKAFGVIAILLAAFVAFAILGGSDGPHGPSRHVPSAGPGGHTRWELLILLGVLATMIVALNWNWLGGARFTLPHSAGLETARLWLQQSSAGRWWAVATMTGRIRKLALTVHVMSSVGLLGAVAGFLALAIVGLASEETQTVRSAYVAMNVLARFIIVPLILTSLVTGLVQALGTSWGLLRHYWVLLKFFITVLVAAILLMQMEGIGYMARVAAETALSASDLVALRRSIRTHAAGGLLVLLVPVVLSIFKPRGITRYGWRVTRKCDSGPQISATRSPR